MGDEQRTTVVTRPVTVLAEMASGRGGAGTMGMGKGAEMGAEGDAGSATETAAEMAAGTAGGAPRTGGRVRTLDEVSMWEQLLMASFMQVMIDRLV